MRGRIPDSILAELRERANIVEVISASISLRRRGRNHVGLCPFHAEKTPSFTVSEDRGMFHCFGCGVGGNVFTFLMRMEGLPFRDVVERLAERYGVTLPERGDERPGDDAREELLQLNEQCAQYFQRYLWQAAEGAAARAYLVERGISRALAERFRVGYAPAAGDVLARRLGGAGHKSVHAVRLGLIGERRGGGGHYDRFRARLMFPIADASGRVIGFGSRSVPGTPSASGELPKYLNSPETPLYHKGAHLYGLALAREAIRGADRALVVEGYFDVLALAEAGIGYAVASLGTALTLDQLRVLKRFTRNIVAFFDGDAAGEKAAEKSLPLFLEAGLWGHATFLPAGDDPDTFVRREGRAAAEHLLAGATPLMDFYLERAVPAGSTPAERALAAQEVKRFLDKIAGKIADRDVFDFTVRRAAERIEVDEALLRGEPRRPSAAVGSSLSQEGAPGPELMLLELMLRDPAVATRVDEAGGLASMHDERLRDLASEIVAAVRRGMPIDAATLLSRLDEGTAAHLAGQLVGELPGDATIQALVHDCLVALEGRTRQRQRHVLRRRIREAETHGNQAAVEQYLRELGALRRDTRP